MTQEPARSLRFAEKADFGEKGFAYDPDQDHEEKREVRRGYRNLQKNTEDPSSVHNAEDLMQGVQMLNNLFGSVKNPQEATLDSAQLLHFSNLGANQARALKSGPSAFDVDEFVSKLIVYMGGGRQLARKDAGGSASDLDMDDDDTPLDWEKIGRRALAKSRRVPVIDFMLGPLAIQPKTRAQVKRTAKLQKDDREKTKPQEIREEDIQRSENETTKNVAQIEALLKDQEAVNLFEFIINPDPEHGFAQTVENLFYLSFLIRDGKCALDISEKGIPEIFLCEVPSQKDYDEGLKKHQHVIELDVETWEDAIKLFDITQPMIPQREVRDVTFRGTAAKSTDRWYG